MTTEDLLSKWISMNDGNAENYFSDFICMYCNDTNIEVSISTSNPTPHNVYMIPKTQLERRIKKYSNCNELYYDDRDLFDPHNPYHDSARHLYIVSHNKEDYLKLWLLLLLRQHEKKDFIAFSSYQKDFYSLYLDLGHYFHVEPYDFYLGMGQYMLPTSRYTPYFQYNFELPIDFYLYKLQSEMNFVKATNFMVILNAHT